MWMIEYQGNINQRFWGAISKNVNVSQVLKILEATGGIKFRVEGNKISVMSAASLNVFKLTAQKTGKCLHHNPAKSSG